LSYTIDFSSFNSLYRDIEGLIFPWNPIIEVRLSQMRWC